MSLHSCLLDDPQNLSTHDLLGFKVTLPKSGSKKAVVPVNPSPRPIPVWNTLDEDLYQSILHKHLSEVFSNWGKPETLSILARLIPDSFIEAAKKSAEFKTPKQPKNFRKNKSKIKFRAENTAREAYRNWKKAGKPRDPANSLCKEKKEARSNLRSIAYNERQKESIEFNNILMEA